MARIVNVPVYQGHPVPTQAHMARGPFSPELLAKPKVVSDYEPQPDDGGDPVPQGGTAQNGYTEARYYRCRYCEDIVRAEDVEAHICSED